MNMNILVVRGGLIGGVVSFADLDDCVSLYPDSVGRCTKSQKLYCLVHYYYLFMKPAPSCKSPYSGMCGHFDVIMFDVTSC